MSGRLYDTVRWHVMRKARLAESPLCVRCKDKGDIVKAKVVDHVIAHKGNRSLFFDYKNTQSLCLPCHNSAKQAQERKGFDTSVSADGWPTDPRHPANRKRR